MSTATSYSYPTGLLIFLVLICQITATTSELKCPKNDLQPMFTNLGLTEVPNCADKDITHLTLSENNFKFLRKGSFKAYPHLVYLKADSNHLQTPDDLEAIGEATSLQFLDLSRNGIIVLDFRKFQTNLALRVLVIDHNPGMEISEHSANLPNLTSLSLRANNLSTIPSTAFERFHNLKILDLRNNRFLQLPDGFLKNVPNLTLKIDEPFLLIINSTSDAAIATGDDAAATTTKPKDEKNIDKTEASPRNETKNEKNQEKKQDYFALKITVLTSGLIIMLAAGALVGTYCYKQRRATLSLTRIRKIDSCENLREASTLTANYD